MRGGDLPLTEARRYPSVNSQNDRSFHMTKPKMAEKPTTHPPPPRRYPEGTTPEDVARALLAKRPVAKQESIRKDA